MQNLYPKFSLGTFITTEQRRFFNEHGFIHFENFISPEAVKELTDASHEVQQQLIESNTYKINGVPLKYGIDLDGKKLIQRFAFINQQHEVFERLADDKRFRILLNLVGPEARLGIEEKDGMVFNHYVSGPESRFTKMGWHTDGLRDIFHGQKLNPMLNVGIHLSNLKPKNGGLRIIPGTHKQNMLQLLFRKRYFVDNKPDRNELAIIPKAGDLTIHDGRLWHRVAQSSVAGEESRRRVIYIPIIAGEYAPKHQHSPTAFYQRFAGIVR
ncbi:phytanoyl-CoA dioxygenase family protein [Mucilaginibacter sp. BT774]|uniref:phytanoyl-CoA dioxygenase family protein n=1 Tax=Mucilaginibacter sp. BT774 TaxID=3062276 RepID=UPI002676A4DC|nr:phytanoyl-CoA dioxygenase family protein [Mucilaginibacter sp. BT774]MDO3626789.1 phytanoyl-CoA dioxygenase family protein [Mucilaginibacter sp. BT774]